MTVDAEKAPPVGDAPVAQDVRRGSVQAGSIDDVQVLDQLGYKPELARNRSMATLLFQSLAIAAIPYGEGGPLISAIYGGGPLAIFVGWIVVLFLDECVALSLSELASKYPTSAGPYYWSFQLASRGKTALSFITGWTWLVGNWTISMSISSNIIESMLTVEQLCRSISGSRLSSWQLWPCTTRTGWPKTGSCC
jgi:amino acid transporter